MESIPNQSNQAYFFKNSPSKKSSPNTNTHTSSSNTTRASSLGTVDYTPSANAATATNVDVSHAAGFNSNNKLANVLAMRSSSSHFQNRASYKGECKRLMTRGNIETVAERAAHFEEVDPERYNRLKNKFYELDVSQQQELLQMHNMQYPAFNNATNSNSTNSNLYLLNHFVESLMMTPPMASSNFLANNYGKNSSASLSKNAYQTTKSNLNEFNNNNQTNTNNSINANASFNMNASSKIDYLSKVADNNSKKVPTYDDLLGKYEQNINKYYSG